MPKNPKAYKFYVHIQSMHEVEQEELAHSAGNRGKVSDRLTKSDPNDDKLRIQSHGPEAQGEQRDGSSLDKPLNLDINNNIDDQGFPDDNFDDDGFENEIT